MEYEEGLVKKFARRGLVLDSNLLLLLLVGLHNPNLIGDGKYNRLQKYDLEDFNILVRFRKLFSRTATTPHILTELSNLANDFSQSIRARCFNSFRSGFVGLDEIAIPSSQAVNRREFSFLGLTDCILAELTLIFLVVSDDARLVKKLGQSGLESFNFNHLRQYLLTP